MKTNRPLLGVFLLTCALGQPSFASATQDALDHYFSVQSALAQDSIEKVSVSAQGLAKVLRGDETKSLPTAIADQADALAKATNLSKPRKPFKPLSESLLSSSDATKANALIRAAPGLPVGRAVLWAAAAAKQPAEPGTFNATFEDCIIRQGSQATNSLANGSTGVQDLATGRRGGETKTPSEKSAQPTDRVAKTAHPPKALVALLPRGEVLISGDKAIGDSSWQPHGFRLFRWSW